MLRKIACAFMLLAAFSIAAYAYEIRVSRLNSWELAFDCKPPRTIDLHENSSVVYYTYVIYEVKNESSQEIDLFPTLEIESENNKSFCASVYPSVEQAIKERFGKDLLGFSQMSGIIKPGEAKKGVAVFKAVDPQADKLTLYVGGLSGDFKMDKDKDGKLVTMYRTYKAVYYRPGDEWHLVIDPVTLESSEWVWRE